MYWCNNFIYVHEQDNSLMFNPWACNLLQTIQQNLCRNNWLHMPWQKYWGQNVPIYYRTWSCFKLILQSVIEHLPLYTCSEVKYALSLLLPTDNVLGSLCSLTVAYSVWRCVILQVFCYTLIFFDYFASSNLSLSVSSCRHFSPLHVWLPFLIKNGRFI